MPELPEVQTTVNGINKYARGLEIRDAWTDYFSLNSKGKNHIKNKAFFAQFRRAVTGAKIVKVQRRAKNILITLSNHKIILIHMKMTGHILYGKYQKTKNLKDPWRPKDTNEALKDPFNRFIHFVLSLSNGKHLALSDVRKFAKVTVFDTETLPQELQHLGPEPLARSFTAKILEAQLKKRPKEKIKAALMNQTLIAGIGNIYSDEVLFASNIHPLTPVSHLAPPHFRALWKQIQIILQKGIDFGGDSTSDYRALNGQRGNFQYHHKAYRKTGSPCLKRGCKGTIKRIVVHGRSAHFCPIHQKLL